MKIGERVNQGLNPNLNTNRKDRKRGPPHQERKGALAAMRRWSKHMVDRGTAQSETCGAWIATRLNLRVVAWSNKTNDGAMEQRFGDAKDDGALEAARGRGSGGRKI